MITRLLRSFLQVTAGFIVAMWLLGSCTDLVGTGPAARPDTAAESARPSPHVSEPPPVRLLPAVSAKRNKNYVFMSDINGALWDPCLPVRYVVNPGNQPAGGLKAIQKAVATVSAATGLKFEYAGRTREKYSADRADYQPLRYPEQWAPILITWETDKQFNRNLRASGESSSLSRVVGWGGPRAIVVRRGDSESSEAFIISGTVTLRASYLGRLMRNGDGATARAIIIHELGHVVGLDHVKSRSQVMNATTRVTRLGAGDRYGFARAGSRTCAAVSDRPMPRALE